MVIAHTVCHVEIYRHTDIHNVASLTGFAPCRCVCVCGGGGGGGGLAVGEVVCCRSL